MKININKFLDLFYTIMNDDEIDAVDVLDIVEVIKIIFSSDEFQILSTRLDINELSEKQIMKHRYTTELDDDGIVSFNVPAEERIKLSESNTLDMNYIRHAINKCAVAKALKSTTKGIATMMYDGPNGVYNMPKAEVANYKAESKLFTDGDCVNNTIYKSNENNSSTRTVKLENATFSLFTYYVDSLVDKIEVRGTYRGDYYMLLEEVKKILNYMEDSYSEVIKESPKVYKFKCH